MTELAVSWKDLGVCSIDCDVNSICWTLILLTYGKQLPQSQLCLFGFIICLTVSVSVLLLKARSLRLQFNMTGHVVIGILILEFVLILFQCPSIITSNTSIVDSEVTLHKDCSNVSLIIQKWGIFHNQHYQEVCSSHMMTSCYCQETNQLATYVDTFIGQPNSEVTNVSLGEYPCIVENLSDVNSMNAIFQIIHKYKSYIFIVLGVLRLIVLLTMTSAKGEQIFKPRKVSSEDDEELLV